MNMKLKVVWALLGVFWFVVALVWAIGHTTMKPSPWLVSTMAIILAAVSFLVSHLIGRVEL